MNPITDIHELTLPQGKLGCPFAIAFVYTIGGKYMIKGRSREVHDYIRSLPPCVYYMTLWKKKRSRGYWTTTIPNMKISTKKNEKGRKIYQIIEINEKRIKVVAEIRRMPRHWIPLYNQIGNI